METTHNTLKQAEEPIIQADEKPEKKKGRSKFWILLEGSFLTRERMIRQLPFLVLITLMGVFYIFNSNYSDKLVIQINNTKKELKELRFNYIYTKAKLMQSSRQSELVNRLASQGIKESMIPPRKIIVEETE